MESPWREPQFSRSRAQEFWTVTSLSSPAETRNSSGRVLLSWFAPQKPGAESGNYFLFVGTLEPRKNLAGLVDAWRQVRRRYAIDLVIAGRRRADAPSIAEEPGLRLLGEVPDGALPELYSGAKAVVYPSFYEGFGLPVLEAMQCGAPLIASRAVSEVALDAAIYANSTEELAQAMEAAIERPAWLAEYRSRSLEHARLFSWDRTARLTYEVYQEARKRFAD